MDESNFRLPQAQWAQLRRLLGEALRDVFDPRLRKGR